MSAFAHSAPPRPPKPVPFGGAIAEEKKSTDEEHSPAPPQQKTIAGMDTSERSRASLSQSLQSRRASLTTIEHCFLEELCIHGNEIEVQLALETLNDTELFFDQEQEDEESQQGWPIEQIAMGREVSAGSALSDSMNGSEPISAPGSRRGSFSVGNGDPLGSERRQALLETRRNSQLHIFGNLWKAHDTGLKVSQKSSQRSVLSRQQSLSSTSRRDIFQRQRHDDIFRSGHMNDAKSNNTGRRSWSAAFAATKEHLSSTAGGSSTRRGSMPSLPPKPQLRRMMSEGSRKSVTFSKNVPSKLSRGSGRATSESNIGKTWAAAAAAANQDSSPHSIRHGHAVRSDSISISSIPSLHHAHSVHSIKAPSTTSGDGGGGGGGISSSPSSTGASSVPSLHHGHPVRSDSAVSSFTGGANSVVTTDDEADGRDPRNYGVRDKQNDSAAAAAAAWIGTVPTKVVIPSNGGTTQRGGGLKSTTQLLTHDCEEEENVEPEIMARPVLMRDASVNLYDGEGIEVADWVGNRSSAASYQKDTLNSLASFGGGDTIRSSNSFDETMSYERMTSIFRRSIPRSLSDEEVAGIFLGPSKIILRDRESISTRDLRPLVDDDSSWQLMEDEEDEDYYDAWKVLEDEYDNGYGGNGTLPFLILGTSGDDVAAHPHVMSPPLLESLGHFSPFSKQGENFWMKYSMVRDGASLPTFLQYVRGAKYTLLAIETVEGEVFGSFTSEPWRKNWNFFGSNESFLWRMRHTRKEKTHSIIDQAHMESEIDVFPYTGENDCIQLCTHDQIAVGGGTGTPSFDVGTPQLGPSSSEVKEHDWGFGLAIQSDLLCGTSSPCATFGSPGLSKEHPNGEVFEIINLELWTLTPCGRLEDAQKLDLGKLFLEHNRKR